MNATDRTALHPRVAAFRRARRDQGLTLDQLAERAGVSRSALQKWFGGESLPNVEAEDLVAGALGFKVVLRPSNEQEG